MGWIITASSAPCNPRAFHFAILSLHDMDVVRSSSSPCLPTRPGFTLNAPFIASSLRHLILSFSPWMTCAPVRCQSSKLAFSPLSSKSFFCIMSIQSSSATTVMSRLSVTPFGFSFRDPSPKWCSSSAVVLAYDPTEPSSSSFIFLLPSFSIPPSAPSRFLFLHTLFRNWK